MTKAAEQLVQLEAQHQAAEQVSVSNGIGSLRLLIAHLYACARTGRSVPILRNASSIAAGLSPRPPPGVLTLREDA